MPNEAVSNSYEEAESRKLPPSAERLQKTKYFAELADTFAHNDIEEFADSPAHRSVYRDCKAYVDRIRQKFNHSELGSYNYRPKALELLMALNGVGLFRGGEDRYDQEGGSYSAEQIWTNEYDDYSNRVDTAIFLRNGDFQCPIAFDVTTTKDKDTIREKILVNSNDHDLGYNVGFTDICFCRDSEGNRTWQTRVPKYCIGVDGETIDKALDSIEVSEWSTPSFDTKEMATVMFKALFEMRMQNRLFHEPLIDEFKNDEHISEEDQQCLDRLGAISGIIDEELKRLVGELPEEILSKCTPNKNGEISPGQVAILFQNKEKGFRDEVFSTIVSQADSLYHGYISQPYEPYRYAYLKEMAAKSVYQKSKNYKGVVGASEAVGRVSDIFYGTKEKPVRNPAEVRRKTTSPPQSERPAA